jgi:hypothetical protein
MRKIILNKIIQFNRISVSLSQAVYFNYMRNRLNPFNFWTLWAIVKSPFYLKRPNFLNKQKS